MKTATVTIGEKQWLATVAVTPQELAAGLSGLESMPAGAGMLFDLGSEQPVQITTEAMLFNIDIIFVSEALQVVDIVLGAPPGYLITEETPVRYFLEVNAGEAETIGSGDSVSIDYTTEEEGPLPGETPGITGFMQLALTAAVMGLFVGGMLKMYSRTALGKPKPKELPPPALEYPRYEYLSSTGMISKPGHVRHQTITGSKPPAVIPTKLRPSHPKEKTSLDFLADSPEFLAYTIDDIGYREKLDNAFQTAITRVNRRS